MKRDRPIFAQAIVLSLLLATATAFVLALTVRFQGTCFGVAP